MSTFEKHHNKSGFKSANSSKTIKKVSNNNNKKLMNNKSNNLTVDKIKQNCNVNFRYLKKHTNSSHLPSTTYLADGHDITFGQDRAINAIQTALEINANGYHIFAAGENGLGKRTFVINYLKEFGFKQSNIYDDIYVHNFDDPNSPIHISIEPYFVDNLQDKIKKNWNNLIIFSYKFIVEKDNQCQQSINIDSDSTNPTYLYQSDLKQNNINQTNSHQTKVNQINENQNVINQTNLATDLSDIELIKDEFNSKSTKVLEPLYDICLKSCTSPQKLISYLDKLQLDMINTAFDRVVLKHLLNNNYLINTNTLVNTDPTVDNNKSVPPPNSKTFRNNNLNSNDLSSNNFNSNDLKKNLRTASLNFINSIETLELPNKYLIKQIRNHQILNSTATKPIAKPVKTVDGAPIIFEYNPTINRLLGTVHTKVCAGSKVTDHTLIESGSLHLANGGYLIIDANHLLEQPSAWHELKLTLQSRELSFNHQSAEKVSEHVAFKPEPIPLNVKIILLGEPDLYDQFVEHDSDFLTLFKIRADFHNEVSRIEENELKMCAKMADIVNKYDINHFEASALAEILDYLSLLCEDQKKLSLHTDSLIKLMLEASRQANKQSSKFNNNYDHNHQQLKKVTVSATHVEQALADMSYRSGYLKELYLQEITDGQQLINTSGTAVGQINVLTIINYADTEFGMPALLTAVVQHNVGSGDILDIERDVELGGSLHAKGMLIMNSYLRALFSPYQPLNFTASLAFEQSYAHIDGDSATLAEACALLSALADTPISQSLGITGSMNQLGRVQAVGGINAKVTGFYDACLHQGLTGNQGVILPAANISQLMLRDDIISAVKSGEFHIYGVNTVGEALTILAETDIDTLNKKGKFKKKSLFGKIIKNLELWEQQLNPPEVFEIDKTDLKH